MSVWFSIICNKMVQMLEFRGGSEFHKYTPILTPDLSQLNFILIMAIKCVDMLIYVFYAVNSFHFQFYKGLI